jgi:hypothetical protein
MSVKVDEVIVGCGASALAHLYYAIKSSFTMGGTTCVVIGEDDLWKKIAGSDPGHRFGQPGQIVHVKGNQPTSNRPAFQTAQDIDSQLDEMRQFLQDCGVGFVYDMVRKIDRDGERIRVKSAKGREYRARRVIVATGFGRSSLPRSECPPEVKLALTNAGAWGMTSEAGMFQNRIIGGTEYLYARDVKAPTPPFPFRVAVQGSSATSSWAVLRALSLVAEGQKVQVTWITRSGFQDANPAGRNSDILQRASDNGWLTRATVKAIGKPQSAFHGIELVLAPVTPEPRGPAPDLTNLGKAYKKWYSENTSTRRNKDFNQGRGLQITEIKYETPIYVDHFVYALGADPALPGGAGAILSEAIKGQLSPVVDMDRRFDDDPDATTLAFKTADSKVWIVGAAVFRGGGIQQLAESGKKFANIAGMMCEAGSPPEGIAAIIAGAKALTGWDENDSVRRINLHTADFKEIETWFDRFYRQRTGGREPAAATKRAMADQIVAMRKHKEFGLSEQEITNLADPDNPFWNELFNSDARGPHPIDQLARFAK